MKNATLIPNLLLAGAMTFVSAALATESVTWFEGGVDTSWPAQATGGQWYCQNLANLKWTETFVPSVDKKVPGVTLDNWAYVGLKFTAAERLSLGLGGGVTEASFSTTVLLTPIMKDDLPGFDADDKGGVILVHEDDGSLRYYVLAQSDEEKGSGANVWKRAGSIPRVSDDAPATIGIRLHQDGKRWLVDYTVNGATEASRVIALGLAPTLSALRFTGPCTVQALSGSYVAYPAWLDTENPVELAKYDTWAAKYGVTDVAQALQKAYLLDCANTAEAIAAAKLTAATVWFDGGVDARWPNHTVGGQWKDVGARTWSASAQGVGLGASATAMTFAAGEALALDTAAGQAGATVTTRVTFVPHTQLPAVESDDVTGLVLLQETNGFRYYVIAQQDEQTGAGANVWKATRDLPVLSAAPTTPATVSVRIFSRGGQCQAEYTVDGVAETAHVVAVGSTPTLGRVSYSGSGTLSYLAATLGGGDVEPHDHAWTATAAGSQLTATCTAENCPFVTAVLALTGTETKVADGTPLTATLEGSSAFVAKTGATVGSVAYFQGATQLSGAPTEAGSYEARVTVQLAGSAYTLTRALTISEPPPAARYDITVTTPSNGTLTTSPSGSVAAGTTVTVTATAAEGYTLAAITVNGSAIAGTTFTMPAEAVTVAATFEKKSGGDPQPEPMQMFYIGTTGYDSWADAYAAAKNGDTITVGKNAVFAVSGTAKSITIDLCGRDLEWTASGWGWDGLTVTDSVGSGQLTLSGYSRNVNGLKLDLSSLNKDQLTGGGIFWASASTEIKFPKGMTLAVCTARVGNASNGTRIVAQGVTYTYENGSWVGSGKVYPEWIDAASTAETGKYDAWAAAKGVTDPTAALEDAYLLNCANTAAAVETAKAAFQITSISVGANEAVVLGLPEGDFNGTVTVLGCETVNGTYHVKKVGDHFFKAVLGK